jgi:two-component system OmpR family response regulator
MPMMANRLPDGAQGSVVNILLLEDDIDLGQAVAEHLEAAGHQVHWCKLVEQARRVKDPELALLDLNLPDGDGLTLLREWRNAARTLPVLVLTARDQVRDRILGLQAGADDYVVKPFDLNELLARIDAVCRRGSTSNTLRIGDVVLDLSLRSATRNQVRVDLTAMEWAVVSCLARHPGRIYSRGEIDGYLSDEGIGDAESNSLEVIISRLRKKLGPMAISTHRGMGYRLDI